MKDGSFPIDDFEQRLARLFEMTLEQIAVVFGLEVFDTAKHFDGMLELKAEEADFRKVVRTWLREHSLKNAKSISQTIKNDVRKVLQQQFKEGFGEKEAVRKVGELLGKGKAYAIAQRIARTEAHTAATLGQHKAAETSGVDLVKEWGATEDHRTRPTHAAADNQTREMKDKFNVGSALLNHPGDPAGPPGEIINCRCVALYWPRNVAPHPVTYSNSKPETFKPTGLVVPKQPKPTANKKPIVTPPPKNPGLIAQAIKFSWANLLYERAKLALPGYNAAVRYQGSGYREWNKSLRAGEILSRNTYRDTLALDDGFKAFTLKEPGTVYRGGVFKQGDRIVDRSSGKIVIGTEFSDHGFISTSADIETARSFAKSTGFVFRIDLQAGASVFGMKHLHLGNQRENEIVLPRGTRFRVIKELGPNEYLLQIIDQKTPPIRSTKARKPTGEYSTDKFTWAGGDIIVH